MHSEFSRLVCGEVSGISDGRMKDMLVHHQTSIDYLLDSLLWLGKQEDERIELFAPFLGRALLELSITALIGRLDPFRLLFVAEVQKQAKYETHQPWKASIRWQGDVLASKVSELWSPKIEYEKVTKALLGDYYDHLVWRPAFTSFTSSSYPGGQWLADLQNYEVDKFISRERGELERYYSTLSKGVHHEFVLPGIVRYDKITITDTIIKTVRAVANLSLVSHFVDSTLMALTPDDAIATFNRTETAEVI